MLYYYILPITSFILACISVDNSNKRKPIVLYFCSVFYAWIIMFGGLRSIHVGVDTFNYFLLFNYPSGIEYGFKIVVSLAKSIGFNFSFFIFFFFAISFLLKLYTFYKISSYTIVSVLAYCGFWLLVYDMNGIRQGLALSLTGFSFYFLITNRTSLFFCSVFTASLFHVVAIILLPLYYLERYRFSYKLFYILLVGVLILIQLHAADFIIDNIVMRVFPEDSRIALRSFSYRSNTFYNTNVLYSFSTFSRLFVLLIVFFFVNKLKIAERVKNIFLWCASTNFLLYLLFSEYDILANRSFLYIRFYECYFWGCLPSAFLHLSSKIFSCVFLCLYVLLQIWKILSIPDNHLIPYSSTIGDLL